MVDSERLTVKRIGRVLRRVRVSCKALQKCHSRPQHAMTTYVTLPSTVLTTTEGPLTTIPPSSALTSRILSDDGHTLKLELSHKIYAVRDAYRDLVLNSARSGETATASSLAALCAIVVGGNVELDDDEQEGDGDDEGHEALLYDAVPHQYRRWMLLSHAANMILTLCPPHATLYRILLDVALAQGLAYESEVFLKALLDHSFDASDRVPYICHPLHTRFLLDLRSVWTSTFAEPCFIRILNTSLSEARSFEVWSSSSFDLALKGIIKRNPDFLFEVSFTLIELFGGGQYSDTAHKSGQKCTSWIVNYILPRFKPHISQISDLIQQCSTLKIHKMSWLSPLVDIISCISTLVLSVEQISPALIYLHLIQPKSSTYNALVAQIFRTSESTFHEKARFAQLASTLSSHGLYKLESSLWGCILQHIDTHFIHSRSELKEYHQEVTDLLEEAEQRCFDTTVDRSIRWDPIGCWTRAEETPPRKRQKRQQEDRSSAQILPPRSPFVSLLRRAASKRVVLHPVRINLPPISPPPRFLDTYLSSDDLDMLAFSTSP